MTTPPGMVLIGTAVVLRTFGTYALHYGTGTARRGTGDQVDAERSARLDGVIVGPWLGPVRYPSLGGEMVATARLYAADFAACP